MYQHCIFCSASLGSNDSIERFPVGRSVAFDAGKGRLWAVCPACARWNLAPLEERWEAVEDAERLFRDTRLRVQSENVGLARLPDGTRLVRVGKALPGELAVWRYGRMLRRRRGAFAAAVAIGAGVPVAAAGSLIAGSVGATAGFLGLAYLLMRWAEWRPRLQSRSLLPYTGLDVDVFDLKKARFAFTFDAEVSVELEVREDDLAPGMGLWSDGFLVLTAEHGRALLRRGMVQLNEAGAGARRVQSAVDLLAASGSADAFLRTAAAEGAPLAGSSPDPRVRAAQMLAAEMAVHDDLERDALEGEMAALEAMWREAEEIAGIADSLPDADAEPPRLDAGF